MLAPFTLEAVALGARSVYRIENARGTAIACVRGATWVTQERDPRDLILTAGQSVVLDKSGLAVVYALKDAVFTVGAAWQQPAAGRSANARQPERACA